MEQDNNFSGDSQKSILTNKKFLILIFLVLVLTIVAVFSFSIPKGKNIFQIPQTPAKTAEVRLSFSPNTQNAKVGDKTRADIIYDGSTNLTKNIIVSIFYNPNEVSQVKLIPFKDPTSSLSYSLQDMPKLSRSDVKRGYASIRLQLSNGATAQKGKGIIAKFEGIVLKTPTTVAFDSESSATSMNSDIDLQPGFVNLNIFPSQ